jgi:hypothetical protein
MTCVGERRFIPALHSTEPDNAGPGSRGTEGSMAQTNAGPKKNGKIVFSKRTDTIRAPPFAPGTFHFVYK